MRLANMVMAMALLCMAFAVILMGVTVGWKSLSQQVSQIPLVSSLENLTKSTMVKSMLLIFSGPIIPLYFAVSFVNQLGRKYFLEPIPCPQSTVVVEISLSQRTTGLDSTIGSSRKCCCCLLFPRGFSRS